MNNIIKRVWNQNRMVNIEDLRGAAFQAEDGGHTFEISGINDANEAVSLSGTVAGVFMRPDGTDVALTGTASDGVVSVTLSDACYAADGRFGLYIFVTSDSKKTCVYACIGTVAQTSYGTVAGDTPQDVVDLINAINAAVATIPADYTALMAAVAPTYSDNALYARGSYAWYDGTLYRCKTDITTAESWTAAHWVSSSLGNDLSTLIPTNLANVTFTGGKYVRFDTGAFVNSTAGSASDYIDVSGLTKIVYTKVFLTQTTVTVWGIAFYDANKVYISGSGVRAGYKAATIHYELAEADVPATATYVRITKHNELAETPVVYDKDDYDSKLPARVAEAEKDIIALGNEIGAVETSIEIQKLYNFPSDDMFPINICHRGLATEGLPENTMVAFKDAVSKGWKFLETDIRSTSDVVWVLLHDSTINRTARNADGTTISGDVSIASITYAQALEYDFGIKAGAAYAGTKIPTLDAFLNYCNKAHVYPVIEVKDSSITQEEADTVWAIVEKYGMQNRIMWLCASYGGVKYFLEKNPYAPAINTSSATWTEIDISALTPESEKPYSYSYKTGKNKVFHERGVGNIASKSLMDNMVDYYHYFGMYAGVYCPTTASAIEDCSDRLDMCTSQYIKYSDAKEEEIE